MRTGVFYTSHIKIKGIVFYKHGLEIVKTFLPKQKPFSLMLGMFMKNTCKRSLQSNIKKKSAMNYMKRQADVAVKPSKTEIVLGTPSLHQSPGVVEQGMIFYFHLFIKLSIYILLLFHQVLAFREQKLEALQLQAAITARQAEKENEQLKAAQLKEKHRREKIKEKVSE